MLLIKHKELSLQKKERDTLFNKFKIKIKTI